MVTVNGSVSDEARDAFVSCWFKASHVLVPRTTSTYSATGPHSLHTSHTVGAIFVVAAFDLASEGVLSTFPNQLISVPCRWYLFSSVECHGHTLLNHAYNLSKKNHAYKHLFSDNYNEIWGAEVANYNYVFNYMIIKGAYLV